MRLAERYNDIAKLCLMTSFKSNYVALSVFEWETAVPLPENRYWLIRCRCPLKVEHLSSSVRGFFFLS